MRNTMNTIQRTIDTLRCLTVGALISIAPVAGLGACTAADLPPATQAELADLDSQAQEQLNVLDTMQAQLKEVERRAAEADTPEAMQALLDEILKLTPQWEAASQELDRLQKEMARVETEGLQQNAQPFLNLLTPVLGPSLGPAVGGAITAAAVPLLGKRGRKWASKSLKDTLAGFNPGNTEKTPVDALKALGRYAGISRSAGTPEELVADIESRMKEMGLVAKADGSGGLVMAPESETAQT